jgi:hypothetical protein
MIFDPKLGWLGSFDPEAKEFLQQEGQILTLLLKKFFSLRLQPST